MNDDLNELSEIFSEMDRNESQKATKEFESITAVPDDISADPPKQQSFKMWARQDDDFFPCERTESKLAPGQYLIQTSQSRGIHFSKKTVNLDSLLVLPDSNTQRILDSIQDFWSKEAKFREHGFLWKRGVLAWGPPGSGKTSMVQQLSQQIVNIGGISVYCQHPSLDAEGLRIIRKIEPKRPIVFILEDIDSIINRHGEAALLALLDGELQVDNIVFVATTNYPELLDRRFINRPSRFDEVIKIGMPSAAAREMYLSFKNPRLKNNRRELDAWVSDTKEFSIAHLRELIVAVECLGHEPAVAIDRLRKMNQIKVTSEDRDRPVGFGPG